MEKRDLPQAEQADAKKPEEAQAPQAEQAEANAAPEQRDDPLAPENRDPTTPEEAEKGREPIDPNVLNEAQNIHRDPPAEGLDPATLTYEDGSVEPNLRSTVDGLVVDED